MSSLLPLLSTGKILNPRSFYLQQYRSSACTAVSRNAPSALHLVQGDGIVVDMAADGCVLACVRNVAMV